MYITCTQHNKFAFSHHCAALVCVLQVVQVADGYTSSVYGGIYWQLTLTGSRAPTVGAATSTLRQCSVYVRLVC